MTVGGLSFGNGQMGTVAARFRAEPRCHVVETSYRNDLRKIIAENNLPKVALLGHSFAALPMGKLSDVADYIAYIDPVSNVLFVSSWRMPDPPRPKFRWFQRSDFGVEVKLKIENAGEPEIVKGGHNDLPHDSALIESLATDVLAL